MSPDDRWRIGQMIEAAEQALVTRLKAATRVTED